MKILILGTVAFASATARFESFSYSFYSVTTFVSALLQQLGDSCLAFDFFSRVSYHQLIYLFKCNSFGYSPVRTYPRGVVQLLVYGSRDPH